MKYAAFALSALLISSPAIPAGKSPAVGTSSAEVIYTLTGRNSYELLVSNEDGTGAVSLFKSANQLNGRLGPRAGRTIAFWNGGELNLLNYDITSTGVLPGTRQVLLNSGRRFASPFDYSGADIAWWHPETNQLHVYNLVGGDHVIATVAALTSVSFSPDGASIFYAQGTGPTTSVMRSIPTAGGDASDVGISSYIYSFDSGHQSNAFAVAYQVAGVGPHLDYIPAGQTSGATFANGSDGAFRCDDKVIIYRRSSGGNSVSTLKYNVVSNSTSTFSTNGNIIFASYMPTC